MEGEIYTEVDASVLNTGISPMATVSSAPRPPEGTGYVAVWYRWRYDDTTGEGGFTGQGWYFNDPDNVLNTLFDSEEAFKEMLRTDKPKNLDQWLSQWTKDDQIAFLNKHIGTLGTAGCLELL